MGLYEELYSMIQNKMAMARLGFELCTLITLPEQSDMGDGPGGKRHHTQTPLAKGGPPSSF